MTHADSLSDGRIRIRPFQATDAPGVYAAVQESLADVTPWMPDLNADLSVEAIAAWIAPHRARAVAGEQYQFAIVHAHNDSFLGGCGLTHINHGHRYANLFYWVRSSRLRQGVASAAVRLLARYAFESAGLQRVEIVVAVGNAASARVAEKVGAAREGILRNRLFLHGSSYDAFSYSLIPGDLDRPANVIG
jgi:ribosomal-protein-serine acetyltransferase